MDAAVLARDEPFPDPIALLVLPDHYVLRLLHADGLALSELGVPGALDEGSPNVRAARPPGSGTTRGLARVVPALAGFRGTSMRLWLEHRWPPSSGSTGPSLRRQRTTHTTRSPGASRCLEMRPRALYRRFGLEVLATTDSPLDDLSAHQALRDDPTWDGRVVPTFRPDLLTDPARTSRWGQLLDRLGAVSGTDTCSTVATSVRSR